MAGRLNFLRWQARGTKPNQISVLVPVSTPNPRTPVQPMLDLQIEKQIEIDGVGMGVLSDGTAFLAGRGLARLCGIDSSRISEMSADWDAVTLPLTIKVKENPTAAVKCQSAGG